LVLFSSSFFFLLSSFFFLLSSSFFFFLSSEKMRWILASVLTCGLMLVPPPNCEKSHACCDDEVWKHVKQFSNIYHVREVLDSTPRMLERYYSFYKILKMIRGIEQAALDECLWGVITVYLNALPAVEYEEGLEAAQAVFLQASTWLEGAQSLTHISNWTIPLTPLRSNYPVILGVKPSNDRCFGLPLRIFVYDTDTFSRGALFCSAGQWGVEVLFHMYLLRSDCRTLNVDEADLFFVPDYRACQFHLAPRSDDEGITVDDDMLHSKVIIGHKEKVRDFDNVDSVFLRLLSLLEHFPKKQGMDHIFLFSDQGFIVNFTNIFPSWRTYMPHSIFATTEAFTPRCDDCFSPWKDIVIPGHLDMDRIDDIRAHNQPSSNRTLFFNFHGRVPQNHEYYTNVTVRADISKLAPLPNISIGGFVENYFEIMGTSHFCLIPEGTSSWTNHLYEAFFAGCIPFILSDTFVLPYQDLIDWKSVSFKWPQKKVGLEMYAFIAKLVTERLELVEAMKKRVDEMQCWFHFYRDCNGEVDCKCSPYYGFLHELNARRRPPKFLYPLYW